MSRFGDALHAYGFCVALLTTSICTTADAQTSEVNFEMKPPYALSGGYSASEAETAVKFCVELDSQDDRLKAKGSELEKFYDPQIDVTVWKKIFDSRQAVAEAYADYLALGRPQLHDIDPQAPDDALGYWWRVFDELEATAKKNGIRLETDRGSLVAQVLADPRLNGFGPWADAWVLYEGQLGQTGNYTIAIRGTVVSSDPSVVDDVWFQPVAATRFLSDSVSYARDPLAVVHSGFAHAAFSVLLDQRFGVLQALSANHVKAGAGIFIVGHSQGAAIATLLHSSLYYAMLRADTERVDPLGLAGKGYRLKSYVFAQPKPGNYQFASDFARLTQANDNAIVINNDIDPVPKLGLTLEASGDLATDFKGKALIARTIRRVSSVGAGIREAIGRILEPFARRSARDFGHFYRYSTVEPFLDIAPQASWNFSPAGTSFWFSANQDLRTTPMFFSNITLQPIGRLSTSNWSRRRSQILAAWPKYVNVRLR